MPNPFFDKKLVTYIKRKAEAGQIVSVSELVDYCLAHRSNLCRDGDEALSKATVLVEDFLARRSLVAQLADQIEQIQGRKQDTERDTLIVSLRRFARRHRMRKWLKVFCLLGIIALLLLLIKIVPEQIQKQLEGWWIIFFYGFIMAYGGLIDRLTGRQRDIEQMEALTKFGGARTVGIVAEAWTIPEVRAKAEETLLRELPKLRASDAPLITTAQRNCLYLALKQSSNSRAFSWFDGPSQKLPLAILKALEQVGDEKAISHVEWVAAGKGNGQIAAVRQAAAACLPFLRERVAQQAISQTLLRPSSATEVISVAPDTLLRPAQYASATEPEQLLRASVGKEAGD